LKNLDAQKTYVVPWGEEEPECVRAECVRVKIGCLHCLQQDKCDLYPKCKEKEEFVANHSEVYLG
jgi:hypothetical protein